MPPHCKLQAEGPVSLDGRRRQLPEPSGGWRAGARAGRQRLDGSFWGSPGGTRGPCHWRGRWGPGLSLAEWAAGRAPTLARCGLLTKPGVTIRASLPSPPAAHLQPCCSAGFCGNTWVWGAIRNSTGQHTARRRVAQSQGDPLTPQNLQKELEDRVPQCEQREFLSPRSHKGGDVYRLGLKLAQMTNGSSVILKKVNLLTNSAPQRWEFNAV